MNEFDSDPSHAVYAKALHALRESRKALLRHYGVADEAALLERLQRRELDVEPAYEHYLAARIVEQARLQLRADLQARMKGDPVADVPEISFHLAFKPMLESRYAARMSEPLRMAQDALLLAFDNDLMMEIRYAAPDAYSVRWVSGETAFRLDTSPAADGSHGMPHLYRDDGSVQPFSAGVPGANPGDWLSALLDLLLEDPAPPGKMPPSAG